MAIFAIDPGRDKCGLVVVDEKGKILVKEVVPTLELIHRMKELLATYPLAVLLVGDGTGSKEFCQKLTQVYPDVAEKIAVVDEYRTSELARRRYLADHRTGWRRFIPLSLQSPDQPYDDYVAEILVERYLAGRSLPQSHEDKGSRYKEELQEE